MRVDSAAVLGNRQQEFPLLAVIAIIDPTVASLGRVTRSGTYRRAHLYAGFGTGSTCCATAIVLTRMAKEAGRKWGRIRMGNPRRTNESR